eukprot:jgi/Chrzof1/1094/Cz01g39270.t1
MKQTLFRQLLAAVLLGALTVSCQSIATASGTTALGASTTLLQGLPETQPIATTAKPVAVQTTALPAATPVTAPTLAKPAAAGTVLGAGSTAAGLPDVQMATPTALPTASMTLPTPTLTTGLATPTATATTGLTGLTAPAMTAGAAPQAAIAASLEQWKAYWASLGYDVTAAPANVVPATGVDMLGMPSAMGLGFSSTNATTALSNVSSAVNPYDGVMALGPYNVTGATPAGMIEQSTMDPSLFTVSSNGGAAGSAGLTAGTIGTTGSVMRPRRATATSSAASSRLAAALLPAMLILAASML